MTKAWAKAANNKSDDNKANSMILAIEEPELYLHPHAQSAFVESIKELASNNDFQVIACTHSPLFVELQEYQSILIAEKCPNDGTQTRQVKAPIFGKDEAKMFKMSYWLNPDRARLFFSQRTILVEGHTEAAIIPMVAKNLGVFSHEVSVIDCGGKDNLRSYMKLCKAFGITYHVIHDEDAGNASEQAENQRITQEAGAHAQTKVSMVAGDMETVLQIKGIDIKGSGKPMKAVNFIEEKTKTELETDFPILVDIVKRAYGTVEPTAIAEAA